MNAILEAPIPAEFAQWTKAQKLAGLVLILSPESASHILKALEEPELEAVCAEMTKFTTISAETQTAILQEFTGVAVEAGTTIPCGADRVQGLLEKSVGMLRASDIITRVAPAQAPVAAMRKITELDATQLFHLLRGEPVQTVALVVSYLSPEKGSQVLSLFKGEAREQAIERLASMGPTSVKVVESVADMLQRKCGNSRRQPSNQTGGIKMAAQVLNAMPKNLSESILLGIRERNPDLGESVRQKMFTFEELGRLSDKTLQRVLQSVDMHLLTISLKTCSEKLKSKLLSCVSKRAADSIREELEFLGPVKLRDIEAAQMEIIETVRRMEAQGEIDLEELRQNTNQEAGRFS